MIAGRLYAAKSFAIICMANSRQNTLHRVMWTGEKTHVTDVYQCQKWLSSHKRQYFMCIVTSSNATVVLCKYTSIYKGIYAV